MAIIVYDAYINTLTGSNSHIVMRVNYKYMELIILQYVHVYYDWWAIPEEASKHGGELLFHSKYATYCMAVYTHIHLDIVSAI